MKFTDWIKLVIWIVVFEAIGFFLGMLTQANLHWYEGLNKSALTPPGSVFSIVWSILYALLAIVGWALWQHRDSIQNKQLIYLFSIQMVMNWAWTPFFFQLHWLGFSFLWITAMVFLNGIIIVSGRNQIKAISLALIPYFLWLIFAAYLNGVIWIYNN